MTHTIVCVSDTHSSHDNLKVPGGNILLHAGDLTTQGNLSQIERVNAFWGSQPHKHKIFIAGNHDRELQCSPELSHPLLKDVTYIENQLIDVEGLRIYGSPLMVHASHRAFCVSDEERKRRWSEVPDELDILLTHCPPFGILDENGAGVSIGCPFLLERVMQIKPRLHVFGHVHEGNGRVDREGISFINAAIGSGYTRPRGPAHTIIL